MGWYLNSLLIILPTRHGNFVSSIVLGSAGVAKIKDFIQGMPCRALILKLIINSWMDIMRDSAGVRCCCKSSLIE